MVSCPTARLSWKASPARIDSMIAGVPAFLAVLLGVPVQRRLGRHQRHRAAARLRRHGVLDQALLDHQHAGRARAADQLVRRQEHRVLVGEVAVGPVVPARFIVDVGVGPGGGVVPERQRAVAVQQHGHRAHVRDDAADVRRRREAADLERPVARGAEQRRPPACATSMRPSSSSSMTTDLGQAVAPGQLVRVVLVGADEHHRPRAWRGRAPSSPKRAIELGRAGGCPRMSTSLLIAPVAPEPQKMTASSSPAPTHSRMIWRASSR